MYRSRLESRGIVIQVSFQVFSVGSEWQIASSWFITALLDRGEHEVLQIFGINLWYSPHQSPPGNPHGSEFN